MHSCIYEGVVSHRRRKPVDHQFQYGLYMVYLDLDELPAIVGRNSLINDNKFAARSFLRGDHLFDPSVSLSSELRRLVRDQTGEDARGPIRLLTQLRHYGYFMSPLNLYYVFDEWNERVEFIVAEVNNTPWNERHCYVLWSGNRNSEDARHCYKHGKEFHVSPFMEMDYEYRWALSEPGATLSVQLENYRGADAVFSAGMALRRHEITRAQLRRLAFCYPLMTARITSGIYYQALKLWWKKCPFYKHPKKLKQ